MFLSAFDVEHAQCLTGYHVFMVSGLDLARAPRRAPLTARKKGSGYENAMLAGLKILPSCNRAFDFDRCIQTGLKFEPGQQG